VFTSLILTYPIDRTARMARLTWLLEMSVKANNLLVVFLAMRTSNRSIRVGQVLAVLSVFILPLIVWAQSGFGQPQIGAVKGTLRILPRVQVINFGTVIYDGRMDVNPTINRIRAGVKLPHNNDGSIFTNRERKLPVSSDSSYYREFVHQMSGFPFPGPQRVIIGKNGVVYYTGDHYVKFYRVN
nr:ribonuclease domain-containing protein [Fimbriimonas sp.]